MLNNEKILSMMKRLFKQIPLFLFFVATFTLFSSELVQAQTEKNFKVQIRISTSMIFSDGFPSNELISLTEKLQNVPEVNHIDSAINSRQRGNSNENRMQINAELGFTDFDAYKKWLSAPESEELLNSLVDNSDHFSMNLSIDKRL